ncbi:MAG: hypothetical protein DDT37_00231 [Firmicutes bacterium]|nr:hypothetical protein [candidate division NPL-UPA2 bacterium]
MNKKAASAKKTKQRILKVAFKLFAAKGYKHVPVDEIIDLVEQLPTITTGVEARWCIRKFDFDIVKFGSSLV